MGRGPSWRLKFIDIDTSFTITTDTGDICGYMVIRAPAGNTEPMYFPAGNAQAIEAVYGVATADWPDIEQATAFNAEYGLQGCFRGRQTAVALLLHGYQLVL